MPKYSLPNKAIDTKDKLFVIDVNLIVLAAISHIPNSHRPGNATKLSSCRPTELSRRALRRIGAV